MTAASRRWRVVPAARWRRRDDGGESTAASCPTPCCGRARQFKIIFSVGVSVYSRSILVDGVSETFLYESVREKLSDPEREVRQHALRVLMDLIPVTQPSKIDIQMHSLLPEILKILGHSSPSLRKGALDSLKKYLKFSNNNNKLMKDLLAFSEQFTIVAPFLVGVETDDKTVKLVVDQLWKDLDNPNVSQEDTAKALARLR
ncbi:unnamed protein product [Psylliodes chrysocephalus]|uniref:Uncharacterized protein n=1 Tax=Psylliodes chrysocephalus TaxID=3402493 RepID=A0A9P0CNF5_9CUCU|nr:unnamed protein product [Psylliodes chrysocephala]